MHVADHDPYDWFLFRDGETLLLDVNCNHSAVGYTVLLQLTPEEVEAYGREGREFLDRLARDTHMAGPGSGLQRRSVRNRYAKECERAFAEWRATQGDGPPFTRPT